MFCKKLKKMRQLFDRSWFDRDRGVDNLHDYCNVVAARLEQQFGTKLEAPDVESVYDALLFHKLIKGTK